MGVFNRNTSILSALLRIPLVSFYHSITTLTDISIYQFESVKEFFSWRGQNFFSSSHVLSMMLNQEKYWQYLHFQGQDKKSCLYIIQTHTAMYFIIDMNLEHSYVKLSGIKSDRKGEKTCVQMKKPKYWLKKCSPISLVINVYVYYIIFIHIYLKSWNFRGWTHIATICMECKT